VPTSVGGMTISLPAQAATLLQQALAVMQEGNIASQGSHVTVPSTENTRVKALGNRETNQAIGHSRKARIIATSSTQG
jgi:hypothetical protein